MANWKPLNDIKLTKNEDWTVKPDTYEIETESGKIRNKITGHYILPTYARYKTFVTLDIKHMKSGDIKRRTFTYKLVVWNALARTKVQSAPEIKHIDGNKFNNCPTNLYID